MFCALLLMSSCPRAGASEMLIYENSREMRVGERPTICFQGYSMCWRRKVGLRYLRADRLPHRISSEDGFQGRFLYSRSKMKGKCCRIALVVQIKIWFCTE